MKNRILLGIVACQAASLLLQAQQVNPYNPVPTRSVGHPRQTPVTTGNPNYVEGRELFGPQGVALDRSANPPILYVADTLNNRVLAWRNSTTLAKGAPADMVIGQRDRFSTVRQGPTQASAELRLIGGLSQPTSVVVDADGNLYVSDAGNNRVLRYPKPFEQINEILAVDLVIGQVNVGSGVNPNRGIQTPSAKTLALSNGTSPFRNGMAFDASSNLWISDPGNNRVLRYPPAQLTPNKEEPEADAVIGQNDFTTSALRATPSGQEPILNKSVLPNPSGIAFDASSRLYVCDAYQRVTMWVSPRTGAIATRLLGLVRPTTEVPNPDLSATKFGFRDGTAPPEGVFTVGNNLFVIDTGNNRILRFDPPETWPAETDTVISPPATSVIGQPDFTSRDINRGSRGDIGPDRFASPVAAAVSTSDVWVVDASNNRVLGFPLSGGTISVATKVVGQTDFQFRGPNMVKQVGFNFGSVFFSNVRLDGAGNGVVDFSSTPPRFYVADTLNNRVLGFRDARNIKVGDPADLVIGQSDFARSLVNRTGDPLQMSDVGLNSPAGVAVDFQGNLWVADTGNGRVLRFPKPFDQASEPRANLVLGQLSRFGAPQREATSRTMNAPWGIAFLTDGHAIVSDPSHHRVLLFRKPTGGDFTDGQAASTVFGQSDFNTASPGTTDAKLQFPRFVSTDTDDRVYVADTGNNRVLVYRQQSTQQPSGLPAVLSIPATSPAGVTVSRESGDVWVAETGQSRVLRFPKFDDIQLQGTLTADVIPANFPHYVTLDPLDNPVITEGINRIVFHFQRLVFRNAASYANRIVAPGMITILGKFGPTPFNTRNDTASGSSWPDNLADVEVFVNERKAPVYFVGVQQVYIQIPQATPAPGQAEVVVQRKSSGQVLAAGIFQVDLAAPAFFTSNQQGTGQIAALNPDGKVNGPGEGVRRGDIISLFGTGIGLVPNAPPDGQGSSGTAPAAAPLPRVVIQNNPNAEVQYFGLAPGFPGLFQLNVKVPDNAVPNEANLVAIQFRDIASNEGPDGRRVVTTIWVR